MENSMELEFIKMQKESRDKVNGIKERELDGLNRMFLINNLIIKINIILNILFSSIN